MLDGDDNGLTWHAKKRWVSHLNLVNSSDFNLLFRYNSVTIYPSWLTLIWKIHFCFRCIVFKFVLWKELKLQKWKVYKTALCGFKKINKTKIKYSSGRESNLCIHYPFTSHNFCQKQNLKARSRFSVNVEGWVKLWQKLENLIYFHS